MKDIVILLGIVAGILILLAAVAAIAPAMLLVAGVEYISVKALVIFAVLVLVSACIFMALLQAIYMIAVRRTDELDRFTPGYVIFETVSVFLAAVFIDSRMDSVEISTISALIFAAGFVILCDLIELILDNMEEDEKEG